MKKLSNIIYIDENIIIRKGEHVNVTRDGLLGGTSFAIIDRKTKEETIHVDGTAEAPTSPFDTEAIQELIRIHELTKNV